MKFFLKSFVVSSITILLFFIFSCNGDSIESGNNNFVKENDVVSTLSSLEFNVKDSSIQARDGLVPSNFEIIENINSIPDEDGNIVYYIINYVDNGFVIVSADNRVKPILAFSEFDKFSFTESEYSGGLVQWIIDTKDFIKSIRSTNGEQTTEVANAWRPCALARTLKPTKSPPCLHDVECVNEHTEVGPLLQTSWHQRCGFNNLLPTINCQSACNRPVAGCVPIAIAQVMKYHNYPTQYNWNDMSNTSGTNSTALLIKDIHTALGGAISPGCNSTGVDTDFNSANLFKNNFNYSTAIKAVYNWDIVKSEIASNRPVILSGGTKAKKWLFFNVYEDGHMWVADGYRFSHYCDTGQDYLYFHMNWGWGVNAGNGWFAYNNFNPDNSSFNYLTKMIYNIKP